MPVPAQQIREQPPMPIQIKQLGLRMRVLKPLRSQEIAERTLAAPGGAEHQEMPHVADMIHDAEQGMPVGLGMEPWGCVEIPVCIRAGPCGRQSRAEMG